MYRSSKGGPPTECLRGHIAYPPEAPKAQPREMVNDPWRVSTPWKGSLSSQWREPIRHEVHALRRLAHLQGLAVCDRPVECSTWNSQDDC